MHGWVRSPSVRGTLDIIWSCAITIILCSWSVLFLNVVAKREVFPSLKTKLRWMVFTIFFPEALVAFAQKQWISAHQSVSDFSDLGYPEWSLEHAYFADMGGFMLKSPDYPPIPISAHQIYYLVANGFANFPAADRQAILDKNKADGFSRVLTSTQALWFAFQCIGRASQHSSISALELETAAFILCTIPTFYFWRHKPSNVSTTITLFLNDGINMRDILIAAGQSASDRFQFTPLDFTDPRPDPYEYLDPVMWALEYLFGLGASPKRRPITCLRNSSRRIGRDINIFEWMILSSIALSYACIHLFAWNLAFPTATERNLWRAASLILVGSPVSYALALVVLTWQLARFCRLFGVAETNTATQLFRKMHPFFQFLIAASWVGSYGIARAYIFVEAFISLRAMPATAFRTVEWSNFFPHF